MAEVTIRELRNHGGEVVDRASAGELITITRSGRPVAVLLPVHGPTLAAGVLVERRRSLPPVDPDALRGDIDRLLDAGL